MRRRIAPSSNALPAGGGVDAGRRRMLKLMAASAALSGSGCSQPPSEEIKPYVTMPEGIVPGDPVFYASTLLHGGHGVGVLVETESGRPIKIEGNTLHPASLGALDAQAQAAILTLWDPDRSRTVMQGQQLSTWSAALEALMRRRREASARGGSGLRLLTGPVSSPTLLAQIGEVLSRFPEAGWHVHDPAGSDAGSRLAQRLFGRPVRTAYRLDRARVVLSVDADLFGPAADGPRNAHDFMLARRREPRGRLYALESTPGLCGALADVRIALPPAGMEAALETIASMLGVPGAPAPGAGPRQGRLEKLAGRLRDAPGACVVAPGHSLSGRGHLLAWQINAHLGNLGKTVIPLAQELPSAAAGIAEGGDGGGPSVSPRSLASLADAMRQGRVDTLLMLDVNPVYDAPGELDFPQALRRVSCSVHMGLYRDETAQQSTWHIPMAHELEAWSDARSVDGTASIVQPVISPLHGGRSPHNVLNVLAHGLTCSEHERVRATWRAAWRPESDGEFERRWQAALRRGVADDAPAPHALEIEAEALAARPPGRIGAAPQAVGLVAVFANDSSVVAGRYSNNAWLQELPRPYTKITWDNAALISPGTARGHGLRNGDVVSLSSTDGRARLLAPIWILPGQADGVITLPLGYGRRQGGSVARGRGFDAYALQRLSGGVALRSMPVELRATGRRHDFARTQHEMAARGRAPVRVVQVRGPEQAGAAGGAAPAAGRQDEAPRREPGEALPSLYPPQEYGSYAWGMSVDLDACIGCNACVIACQAENNIPVVGPEEVARGREMHWIRIDLYRDDDGRSQFQPMACQHCENAPCEVVCPVGATMHDSEGLNVQVYNRCIGTRFCSNNCPYKVRRFNFFDHAATDPGAAERANPDVTVRQRGVMEKCTYCLQRISHARIEAEKAGRRIRDGEVVTACEATCPTQAIVFGDTNDPQSRVSRSKASARDYAVLEELNTRPRTSYLARVEDLGAALEDDHGET